MISSMMSRSKFICKLTVLSDWIDRVFVWSSVFKAFGMVLLTGLLYINIGLSVVIILKSSQEYLVNAGVPQGTIFDPMLFPLLMSFLMMLTNIVFYADV